MITHRCILIGAIFGSMLTAAPVPAADAPEPARSQPITSVTLPPDLDRVLRDYEQAWRAGNAKALASLFAEDGFILQSNRPPIRGRAAIRTAYEGQGGAPLRLRALAFSASDTVGYIIGAYGYGEGPDDTGKFTLTLQRKPGEPWLIFSDMDNNNALPRSLARPAPLPTESPSGDTDRPKK